MPKGPVVSLHLLLREKRVHEGTQVKMLEKFAEIPVRSLPVRANCVHDQGADGIDRKSVV